MTYLVTGLVAFLLFYLYEIHTVTGRFWALKPAFLIGVLLLCFATGMAVVEALPTVEMSFMVLLCGMAAVLFLVLLLYTLFFAVPFDKTYLDTAPAAPKKVCRTGLYGLCRHPGVIWFIGLYLSLWAALDSRLLLSQLFLFSALNLLYIVIQDCWSFPICFEDYAEYQKEVPFLIPKVKKIKEYLGMDTHEREDE